MNSRMDKWLVSIRTSSPSNVSLRASDAGDTLIEILVALVIIGLTVVALLGVLTTSITSSAEYRTLASIDTVLKNMADAFKNEIQVQPGSAGVYTNCATTYQVVSVYPTTAVPGAGVTVFGTDFPPGPVSIVVGGTPIPNSAFVPPVAPVAAADGTVSETFNLPAAFTTGMTLAVSVNSVSSATPLVVGPAASATPPPSAVAGYRANISSIQWWNSAVSGFDSPATESQAACQANPADAVRAFN